MIGDPPDEPYLYSSIDRGRPRDRFSMSQDENQLENDRDQSRGSFGSNYGEAGIDPRHLGLLRQTPDDAFYPREGRHAVYASPDDIFPGHEAALLAQAQHLQQDRREIQPPWQAGASSSSKRSAQRSPESATKKPRSAMARNEDVTPGGPYGPEKDDQLDEASGSGASGKAGAKRAAQACLRCRRQKLRCLGGWPCNRCQKSKNVCDFGRPGMSYGTKEAANMGVEANARLQQLESSVATLLAGLAGGNAAVTNSASANLQNLLSTGSGSAGGNAGVTSGTEMSVFDRGISETTNNKDDLSLRAFSFSSNDGRPILPPPVPTMTSSSTSSWQNTLPPPLHVRPLEAPRRADDLPSISPDSSHQHPRFSNSPHVTFAGPPYTSPSNHTSSGISPASGGHGMGPGGGVEKKQKKLGKGQKAEERLAAVTEGFDPPFKALVYQPAVWDNKEQSRRSSPQPSAETSSRDELSGNPYDRRFGKERDDPVNTGLVDLHLAQQLFSFFVDHCHPFLPVVNVALPDPFHTIRQSPFLISAILAVSARFFLRHSSRSLHATDPLDPSLPARLANLAETHLGQSLLRKQHALSDVQAILIMAAWGLQSGGKGPDAWIATGHGARVARRLGVHKILARATETARKTEPGSQEWTQLDAFLPQWRTWLAWFCFDGLLSLGFGRPQSTQFETVDESGFLQIRLSQPLPRPGSPLSTSLYGDVFIAGQVQLTQIGRDLINWGEMLSDPEKAVLDDPRRADTFNQHRLKGEGDKLDIRMMFKDLNARLDDWSKLWVWSARIARLQAEHMRLCLNSYALGAKPEEDELVAQCLKKALNAAMSTIQTHFESSQTDLALSFATDYMTITLAQAAVFLIRITKTPPPVQAVVNLDPSVVAHYLTMSVGLLEMADMSETRLSTYLAKTIREIARAAGISGLTPPVSRSSRPPDSDEITTKAGYDLSSSLGYGNGAMSGINIADEPFDLENFLQLESQIDLGYLLGLPGDAHPAGGFSGGNGMGQGMNGTSWVFGQQAPSVMMTGADDSLESGGVGGTGMAATGSSAGINGTGGNPMLAGYGMDEFQFGTGMGGGMGLGWMGLSADTDNGGS